MAWHEANGHRWSCADGAKTDPVTHQPIAEGYQPTGHERCEHCGIEYALFSHHVQNGWVPSCTNQARRIELDGIIISGPEA